MPGRELTSRPKGTMLGTSLGRQEEAPEAEKALAHQTDPLAKRLASSGGSDLAGTQASVLNRATASQPARAGGSILHMQRQYGNRHVQRVLSIARQTDGQGEVSSEVEQAIQGARGGGQSLSSGARAQMEPAFGSDFSQVRVHTGGQADTLNQRLGARAFTTGQDIFFRQGEYSPGSSKGQELLAHELTHVVQQGSGAIQGKLSVSQPGDLYEQQADQVAKEVMQRKQIARQSPEEEKEMMGMKRLPGVDANVFR